MGWTKWAKRILVNSFGGLSITPAYPIADHFAVQIKNTAGNMFNLYSQYTQYCAFGGFSLITAQTNTTGRTYVTIGPNDTPELEDDYRIENQYGNSILYDFLSTVGQTGICQAQHVALSVNNDGKLESIIEIKGTNTTANDIVIKEIGISREIAYNSSPSVYTVLMYRKVLDEPITVQPNGTYSFKIRIAE